MSGIFRPSVPLSLFLSLSALLCSVSGVVLAQQGAIVPNSGFVVFGKVSLPDGKPAARVTVNLETVGGVKRDTLTDDQGNYEIRGLTARFRFQVNAVNPSDSAQYTDPVDGDPARSYANRLQLNLYLRYPLRDRKETPPGTISAVEAAREIPKPAKKAYEQGLKSQKENKAEQALTSFNEALQLYPEYFQAFTERGNLLMQHGKLVESLADFERALQINDKYSPALRGAGYCNIQQRKFDAAIEQLQKSLLYEPKVALTHMLLGYANLSLDRYPQAEQLLKQALKLGGDNIVRARVYLAEVYSHEQKFKEAADEIRAYLSLRPDAADAANLKKMEADWRARSKRE